MVIKLIANMATTSDLTDPQLRPQLTLCAFCYEPTDLVRVCLTPQCHNCGLNCELYPELAQCLPECTFQHGPVHNTGPISVQRQRQLFKLVAEMLLTKLETSLQEIKAASIKTDQNLSLAKIYLLLELTSSATIKEQELLHDQVQFQLERLELLKQRLSQDLVTPEAILRQIDQADALLAHYQPIKVQPLLLPGQVLPGRGDIVKLQSFTSDSGSHGGGKLRPSRCKGLDKVALAPAVTDDIVLVIRNNDDNTGKVKDFYNLTRNSLIVATQGVPRPPAYYNDITVDNYFTFSPDGVWLYQDKVLRHRNVVTGVETIVGQTLLNCLASGPAPTQRMAMVCDDPDDLSNSSKIYSAWVLSDQANGQTWTQLWVRDIPRDEIVLTSISLTLHHVIVADLDSVERVITVIIVEFLTGRPIKVVKFNVDFEDDPICFKLLDDYRLHILVSEPGQGLVYYIYNLDGSLAYRQGYFHGLVNDHFYGNFSPIITRSGQLKVLAYVN